MDNWSEVSKSELKKLFQTASYSSLKPKLLLGPCIILENLRTLLKRVHQVTWCLTIHKHLNNVSSLQASKTGSNVTCLELSIRKFRAKINDSLSWKQYSRDFLNKYYTQVLLEHNSSHKVYATVTTFISQFMSSKSILTSSEAAIIAVGPI